MFRSLIAATILPMSSSLVAYHSMKESARPAVALVTGGKSGIGKAIALKIASFPFIDQVFCVSRSIQETDDVVQRNPKIYPLPANVGTPEGRKAIVEKIESTGKQLRFLIHSAGTIDPIKSPLHVTEDELRNAMNINCEAPFLLTTALYKSLCGDDVAGRVLHVSSGAAHGAPPIGWSVYGVTKAAFFQSFKVLEREFRHVGGKVVVGSFKPGVVDTAMQGTIREAPEDSMPIVANFQGMKDKVAGTSSGGTAQPPPKGALDTPENVAFFAEWLLLGTTDDEFGNKDDPYEYDIRNEELYPKWIPAENLPKDK